MSRRFKKLYPQREFFFNTNHDTLEIYQRYAVRKALIDAELVSSELKPHVSQPLTSEQREELANLFSGKPMLSDIIIAERENR